MANLNGLNSEWSISTWALSHFSRPPRSRAFDPHGRSRWSSRRQRYPRVVAGTQQPGRTCRHFGLRHDQNRRFPLCHAEHLRPRLGLPRGQRTRLPPARVRRGEHLRPHVQNKGQRRGCFSIQRAFRRFHHSFIHSHLVTMIFVPQSCTWGGRGCLGYANHQEYENFCNVSQATVCPPDPNQVPSRRADFIVCLL